MTTKARQLAEFIANANVDSDEIATGAVSASKLAATLDLSSKTIVLPSSVTTGSNDFTLDAGGDLILDADGAQIRLKDNNVEFGVLSHETPNFIIKSQVSNGDLVFKANDGGSTITTMTIKGDGGNVGIGTTDPDNDLHVQQSANDTSGGIQVRNSTDASGMFLFVDGNDHGHIDMGSAGNLEFRTGNTDRMFIKQAGRISIGTLDNQLYGVFQVNQTTDDDENGIGLLNSSGARSMRIYVNGQDRSVINSGNGGTHGLVLNATGGQVNFGTNSTANNGHVQLSYGTTVSDPPTLIINAIGQGQTAPGDVYGQIVFRVNNSAGINASGLANTDVDSIAMITAQDWRDGSSKTNEDSGIGFYTSNTSGTLTFRGGFSNAGHFGIGTRNNDAALQRLLTLSDPDPSIHAIDTDNNATCDIIMQDGTIDYRADQPSTQGSSAHIWRVDGSQVAYLTGDGMRFGTDTATGNALGDYEEGTLDWVVRKSDGTAGTLNYRVVRYTKVGRVVHISGHMRYDNNTGSGSGNIVIDGTLPFTPSTRGGLSVTHIRSTDYGSSTMQPISVSYMNGSTAIYVNRHGNGYDANVNNVGANTQTNIVIAFQGTYHSTS